jgi:hypothetical protein
MAHFTLHTHNLQASLQTKGQYYAVGILRSVKFGEREDQSPNAFFEAFSFLQIPKYPLEPVLGRSCSSSKTGTSENILFR